MSFRGHWVNQFILIVTSIFLVTSCDSEKSDYKNKIVVQVNNTSLSAEEFSDLLISRLKSFNQLSAKDANVIAQAKNAIIQDFIVRVVTEQWAKENQIFVRREDLDAEIKKIKSNYSDEIAFRKSLADNKITYDEWHDRLTVTLLERLVITELQKKIKPSSEDELRSYYAKNKAQFQQPNAVKVRQIVLEDETTALRIKKYLAQGQKLSELAKKYSITAEASTGGEIGWIERGYSSVLDNALKLAVGQQSSVLKSPQGYHILEVTEKKVAKTLTFEESKSKIEKILRAEKEQMIYSQWLEEQVLRAKVFKDDDLMKHIQVFNRSGA